MLELLKDIKFYDLLDIFIVSLLIYNFFILITNTRAFQILAGIIVLLTPLAISPWYPLHTIAWILKNIFPIGITALIIIFQPEIRKTLEQLGRTPVLGHRMLAVYPEFSKIVDEIITTLNILSKKRIGAIIVFERTTGLQDVIETGLILNARITKELMLTIFTPPSLLHDGAVIVSQGSIKAASCYLPLTDRSDLNINLGTRHRAALGITEISDALSLIVSEETGDISYCLGGKIYTAVNLDVISRLMKRLFQPKSWWQDSIRQKQKKEEP
ncbi:MAG: diadenylate cyclase CdaA [Candidatus Wallbacteria bacterium]|nr:diadenylate cyclase CdaA [Candidatus Wallbacteria bacterium]